VIKISFVLAKSPSLHHLSQTELYRLAKVATIEHHKAGDFIFRVGDNVDRVYLVESGTCKSFSYTPEDLKHLRSIPARDPSTEEDFSKSSTHSHTPLGNDSSFGTSAESRAPPLYTSRAHSMLALSDLDAGCHVLMLRQGAATLEGENWMAVHFSTDNAGVIRAEQRRPGPLSVHFDESLGAGVPQCTVLGSLRDVWRVEEFSLGKYSHVVRIEFLQGDYACICFDSHEEREWWMKHLRQFCENKDALLRAVVSQRKANAAFHEGDSFGSEEMMHSNPVQAQSDPRATAVLCTRDCRLLVLWRTDFLTIVKKSPIFSLQERLTTLKLAEIIPPGNRSALFTAARALEPMLVPANHVICRAGMRVQAIFIVFRGFASICEDRLELQSQQGRGCLTDRDSTYISRLRRIEKLGVGQAFGGEDARKDECVYQDTLVADTTTVLLRLPLETYLKCSCMDVDLEKSHGHLSPRAHDVARNVGVAVHHLEEMVKDPQNKVPNINQLLNLHTDTVSAPHGSRSERQDGSPSTSPESDVVDFKDHERPEDLSLSSKYLGDDDVSWLHANSHTTIAARTEICDPDHGHRENRDDRSFAFAAMCICAFVNVVHFCQRCAFVCVHYKSKVTSVGPAIRDEISMEKVKVFRRQFRAEPRFRVPRTQACKPASLTSVPALDLTKFMRNTHADDPDDDEANFEEYGVNESSRAVVRSLRQVVQWREPKKRTLSQRVKDLVRDNNNPPPSGQLADAVQEMQARIVSAGLVLRIDKVANKHANYVQDWLRYIFRDLAVQPGGILVYPYLKGQFATAFVKFETLHDFQSGMSQIQRLGMLVQESTVDEIADFHVLHSVHAAAKLLARPAAPSSALTARGHLKGSRLGTLCVERTKRSPCLRPPSNSVQVDLTAVGSSRPWTAPTASEPPLQLASGWRFARQRPGTMHTTRPRALLRQERS
jgi:CRP-like cAMP-binding protein